MRPKWLGVRVRKTVPGPVHVFQPRHGRDVGVTHPPGAACSEGFEVRVRAGPRAQLDGCTSA